MTVRQQLFERAMARLAPPPQLTVSEWADAHRRLPETSAQPGRWRTDALPFLRGVMDAFTDPAAEIIAFMKAAQIGGSEAGLNVLGYVMHVDPGASMVVQPTITMAQAFSKDRLGPMLLSTDVLRDLARARGARERGRGSALYKPFPGGYLAFAGAKSPASLAQRPVRFILADDVDRFPPFVGEEGDPLDLAIQRTTTFWNRKIGIVSTPTLVGGRIDTWYARSDQRRFFVPCPRCGRFDYLRFRVKDVEHIRVMYDERDPSSARLECPAPEFGGCGGAITEGERMAMIAAGEWRPTATSQQRGLVGFHIWQAYSPFVSLAELVDKFLAARARGPQKLRVFVNTSLGEGWEDRTQRAVPTALAQRREEYGEGIQVPRGALCLVAGVDVQLDRLELLVLGFGPHEERWVVDWKLIPGSPKRPETRAELLVALQQRYISAYGGAPMAILATCVDSGYESDVIYDFVLQHQVHRIFATKGYAERGGQPLVGKPSEVRYGRNPRPVRLYPINVDDGKQNVLDSLQAPAPGPGAFHFPAGHDRVDEEFFLQLTAEQHVTRTTKDGVAYQVWVQTRERNEALDAAVMALAAFYLLRPSEQQRMRLDDYAAILAAAEEAARPRGPTPEEDAAPPSAPAPRPVVPAGRVGRPSPYLQERGW